MSAVETDLTWQGELKKTVYVFYQGRDSSQTHATKYLGNHVMITTTGETAYFPYPTIETIERDRLWVYPELPEVDLEHEATDIYYSLKRWFHGVTVFTASHRYTPLYPIDEKGSLTNYTVKHESRSLGQATDMSAHLTRVESMRKALPDIKHTILYGVSRGAATTFSALAEHKYKGIKLCVLEGVPGSISELFESHAQGMMLPKGAGKSLYESVGPWFLGGEHKIEDEHQALGHVDKFPNDIPLVIVSSIKDEVVPHDNSLKLALAVAMKRREAMLCGEKTAPVHFLQLDDASHNYYGRDESVDAQRYQSFIHALYQSLGLPYIKAHADGVQDNFRVSELTKGWLSEQLAFEASFEKADKVEQLKIRQQALKEFKLQLIKLEATNLEKMRMVSMAKRLSLYSQEIEPEVTPSFFSFWSGENQAAKELEAMYQHLKEGIELMAEKSATAA